MRRVPVVLLAALLLAGVAWFLHALLLPRHLVALDVSAAEQPADAAPRPRAFYGRRLEPGEPVVLHGAGQTDLLSFTRYAAAVAPARPLLFMTYVDLRDNLPGYFATLKKDLQHAGPELIVPQIGLSLNGGKAASHYEAQTAAGPDDVAIAQLCGGLRSLERPVFLRIGYEFNAPWNGYDPASYQAAFRRIVQALRGCGLQNVAAVWDWSADAEVDAEAGGASAATARDRYLPYYPGDDAVDWWALNLFSRDGMRAEATRRFLEGADTAKHPVMIGESTPKGMSVDSSAGVLDDWYRPYFALIERSPGIKAFCYIDWDWRSYPQWADWGNARVETAPAVLSWYRMQVSKPLYAGARTRAKTLSLLRAKPDRR